MSERPEQDDYEDDEALESGEDFDQVYPTAPNDQLIDKQVRILWGGQWGCERFDRQGVISGFTA